MAEEVQDNEAGQKKVRKRFKIDIKQEDIDEALTQKSRKCMFARSIARDYPEFSNISVDKEHVRVTDSEKNAIITLDMSPHGRTAMLFWDSGEKIKPLHTWLKVTAIRERVLRKDGYPAPKSSQDSVKKHHGPVPNFKNAEQRAMAGRDRVFGAKLWTVELNKLRAFFGVGPEASISAFSSEVSSAVTE
jgi:hypothetical protein